MPIACNRRQFIVAGAVGTAAALASAAPAFACEITIEPSSTKPAPGDKQQVVVTVLRTHRDCSVPIQNTQINGTNLEIVSQSDWKAVSGGYERELTLSFPNPGEAKLSVVRSCPRGGDRASTTFTVPASADATSARVTMPVATPASATAAGAASIPPSSGVSVAATGTSSGISSQVVSSLKDPAIVLLGVAALAWWRGLHLLRRVFLVLSLAYLGFYAGGGLSPIGGAQYLASSDTALTVAFVVTLGVPLIAALVMGRLFCGWVCPAGALQELVHSPGNSVTVPSALHRWLKYGKYVALVALVAAVRITGEPILNKWDPFVVAWNVDGTAVLLVALGVIVVTSVFFYRPWCRYLCPMGAVFAIASRFSLVKLLPKSSCIACKLCVKACESQSLSVDTERKRVTVDAAECMTCGACRSSCKKDGLALGRAPRQTVEAVQMPKLAPDAE